MGSRINNRLVTQKCLLIVTIAAVLPGCASIRGIFCQDPCADIPKGALPAALGTATCQWQNLQSLRAEQDYFVIYGNEWLCAPDEDGARLGPFGRRHLEELAARIAYEPFTIVIAKSADAGLDTARRAAVVAFLMNCGVADAEHLVVIGRGEANGLYGVEAPAISQRFLSTGISGAGGGGGQTGGAFGGRGIGLGLGIGRGIGGGFGGGF